MICTVSTVKETRETVEAFVERNVRAGADHMVVFLEHDPDGQVELLRRHPRVTPVLTDEAYWRGSRPQRLTRRQVVNATLVNWVLSAQPGVDWLVHLDADECLEVDLDLLSVLAGKERCVRLRVLEAVSTEHGSADVGLFKRKLGRGELRRLHADGLVELPENHAYFNGHVIGKAAVRPGLDVQMGVHRAFRRGGEQMPHLKHDDLAILHYDCVSAADFIRKWTARVADRHLFLRDDRREVYDAVADVLAQDLTEQEREAAMLRVYRRHGEDDVSELEKRGLLLTPRFTVHQEGRRCFTDEELAGVRTLLDLLVAADKGPLRPGADRLLVLDVMGSIGSRIATTSPGLARSVDRAVKAAAATLLQPV